MILVTPQQIYNDFLTVRRFFPKRTLFLLLPAMVFFSGAAEASSNSKIIQTDNISMTGNRQIEADSPRQSKRVFKEKTTVTKPIVFTGSRKTSP